MLASGLRGLAVGEFAWDRQGRSEIAALSADGGFILFRTRNWIVARLVRRKLPSEREAILEPQERISQDVESVPSWQPGRAAGWAESQKLFGDQFFRGVPPRNRCCEQISLIGRRMI